MLETDKKRDLIIEGAIKRFTHYGINKTTMNEIADDLSVSKPSLYYYFPDKVSLILGVVNKIFDDYFEALPKDTSKMDLETTLATFIEIKHKFFQKYFLMHLSAGTGDFSFNSDEIRNHVSNMKQKDRELHEELFRQGMERGELASGDAKKLAELYQDSQAGITSLCIMNGNKELMPSKKALKGILEKQLELSKIFIKGLSISKQAQ